MNAIKDKIFDNYDVTNGSKSFVINTVRDHVWGLQLVWKDFAGTLNGTFKIKASNDGANFTPYAASGYDVNLSTANGSAILQDDKLAFSSLDFEFTVGGITGGSLSATLVMKPKDSDN